MVSTNAGILEREGTLWLTDVEEEFGFRADWQVNRILYRETSAFQEVMVVETEGFGKALVLDGILQTTEKDAFIYNEMITHIGLATHPSPKKVCLIGGGDCGAVQEIVKYPAVEKVDMVEIDPKVVEASRKYLPEIAGKGEPDSRIVFHFEDGVRLVQDGDGEYDILIVDSSDPVGPASQLFVSSFYQGVHRRLANDGLMVCQSQSPVFHPDIFRRVHQQLKEIFPIVKTYLASVPTYPGGIWSFTIASKHFDPEDVAGRSRLQVTDTRYVDENVWASCFHLPKYVNETLREKC
ncbi:spermidine synthase [Marininema mesophilum]|uniref:Polyamine aminopropyltransferase n=1 Tax=Marininema mesophilum TaxID=1048340 RepID=A0A1H3CC84_9BACL|nr:polyamine aminopropyltransferase [Marininema mesophilum]SDX51767.1 spermidine synthase [Marininema mesophilum]